MKTTFSQQTIGEHLNKLTKANDALLQAYPGEPSNRQPIHTLYEGAHLFEPDLASKRGALALKTLHDYAPNFVVLAQVLKLPGYQSFPTNKSAIQKFVDFVQTNGVDRSNHPTWLAFTVYHRVIKKLEREPIEDLRLDFEDGFGVRSDDEEDQAAFHTAKILADEVLKKTIPPYIGIRIKSFGKDTTQRAIRTLDIFLTSLLDHAKNQLPNNFIITLPKVEIPEQVTTLVQLFKTFEQERGLTPGSLKMEIMIETTQSIFNAQGEATIRSLINATEGRCVGAHFGVYDYTASCDVNTQYQVMDSPICDFARHVMKVAVTGTGIFLSDGATNVMPVGPHQVSPQQINQPLTLLQIEENIRTVHQVWKLGYDHIQHSLKHAFYQGWDLHPAQLPIRYAAYYSFFLNGFNDAATRFNNYMKQAAQANLSGDVFDDAATGQALLNYFSRALTSGAINEDDLTLTGLTVEEIRTRSFLKILKSRMDS